MGLKHETQLTPSQKLKSSNADKTILRYHFLTQVKICHQALLVGTQVGRAPVDCDLAVLTKFLKQMANCSPKFTFPLPQ